MLRNTAITYEEELMKHPELKESDVQMLREWCAKQPHLPKIPDVQLVVFLHVTYFSVEATKTRIESYFTMRTHAPEFFSHRDLVGSKGLRMASKTIVYVHLKKRTDDGNIIVYSKLIDFNPKHFNYTDYIKYINMVCDLHIHTVGSYSGYQVVFNAQGITMGHVSRISPMTMRKYLLYVQEALPARLIRIHFINVVHYSAVEVIMRMIKSFVKKEFVEKLRFYSTSETLAKFLLLDALPNEDGGSGGNMADLTAEFVKWLEDNRAWFQTEEATMRVNESLRPGKGKTSADVFGVDGTFKNLKID